MSEKKWLVKTKMMMQRQNLKEVTAKKRTLSPEYRKRKKYRSNKLFLEK